MNSKDLLQSYRSLWKNRALATSEENPDIVLMIAIEKELRDENTHPRVRKDKQKKLIAAIKRINDSSLSSDMKVALIDIHFEIFDTID
ncbi:hypothetical protein [Cytobacillus kochii]|uniref:hypothetical protein n=1 Tax=Cytobacillus kochii TaxID=859143 RepID=UPI002481932A|nr:hypothetical protein [Cytobacillus kochii]